MGEQIKVELQEWMGSDRSIADAAWTSSSTFDGKKLKTDEDVAKLVNMLADQKHSTPFESVVFRFWIKMPIQTDRQHMTHRIASHNGMSGRYRTMPDEFIEVPQDIKEILEVHPGWDWEKEYNQICSMANNWYRLVLQTAKECEKDSCITNQEYKRIREFFRGALPQNNMTERVTVMNLRSFANYQKLRNSEYAQVEIYEVAKKMLQVVEKANICPIALEALKRNNWTI